MGIGNMTTQKGGLTMAIEQIKLDRYVDEEVLVHAKLSGTNIVLYSQSAFEDYVVTV